MTAHINFNKITPIESWAQISHAVVLSLVNLFFLFVTVNDLE